MLSKKVFHPTNEQHSFEEVVDCVCVQMHVHTYIKIKNNKLHIFCFFDPLFNAIFSLTL